MAMERSKQRSVMPLFFCLSATLPVLSVTLPPLGAGVYVIQVLLPATLRKFISET